MKQLLALLLAGTILLAACGCAAKEAAVAPEPESPVQETPMSEAASEENAEPEEALPVAPPMPDSKEEEQAAPAESIEEPEESTEISDEEPAQPEPSAPEAEVPATEPTMPSAPPETTSPAQPSKPPAEAIPAGKNEPQVESNPQKPLQPEVVPEGPSPEPVVPEQTPMASASPNLQLIDGRLVYISPETLEIQSFTPGFLEIDGAAYCVAEDGESILNTPGLVTASDGSRYFVESNATLRLLPAGKVELNGVLYWNREAGYALQSMQAGLTWMEGGLYAVQADGSLLCDATSGVLYFGTDGRYTTKNAALDKAVLDVFAAAQVDPSKPEAALRGCYDYIRDHFTYLSRKHYAAGTTSWAEECASYFFEKKKGNCYCWAAAVMYCARQLGYQATVVAGWESNPNNEHAWTMIDWPDGGRYLFDAELEYAYLYMYHKNPVNMFKASTQDGKTYNGFAYYFPQ